MNPAERLRAALGGQPVDRPPVAFWRHFPGQDEEAESQARAHVAFYRQHRPDLLKLTPPSGYHIEDWGATFGPRDHPEGTRQRLGLPVREPADWTALEPLDPGQGVLGVQLEALRRVRAELPEVPLVFTAFSPLTTFRAAVGEAWLEQLRHHPREAGRGLEVVTETARRLARAALAAGADGVFLASQVAVAGWLEPQEFRAWERQPLLDVLAAAEEGWCNVLHLHSVDGQTVLFPLVLDYPVAAVNWHDRLGPPTLHEARRLTTVCLMGGLEQHRTLRFGSRAQVMREALDALRQTEGRGHVLTAGCVLMIDTPEANLTAVRRAAEGFA